MVKVKKSIFDKLDDSTVKYAFFFLFDHRKRIIFYNKISGLVNSIIGNKPFKRISNWLWYNCHWSLIKFRLVNLISKYI